MTTVQFRKKPVVIEAVQWTGDNEDELYAFTGAQNFAVIHPDDRPNSDDPEATASVFDVLHSTWVLVYTGQWVIKGAKGEFYPINEQVLSETYDRVNPLVEAAQATGEAATEFVEAWDRAARDARRTR